MVDGTGEPPWQGDTDALLGLMAGLEDKLGEIQANPPVPATESPSTLETLPGDSSLPVPTEAAPPVMSTVPFDSPQGQVAYDDAHAQRAPLSEHPVVRNLLIMLPYDMQMVLTNVLSGITGMRLWKVAVICVALMLAGFATGYIAVPVAAISRVKSFYQGFACPAPEPVKIPSGPQVQVPPPAPAAPPQGQGPVIILQTK